MSWQKKNMDKKSLRVNRINERRIPEREDENNLEVELQIMSINIERKSRFLVSVLVFVKTDGKKDKAVSQDLGAFWILLDLPFELERSSTLAILG